MLEFEKKVMLTKAEYDFLEEHWQALSPTAVQINHYYDTDDFELDRQGRACRGSLPSCVRKTPRSWTPSVTR